MMWLIELIWPKLVPFVSRQILILTFASLLSPPTNCGHLPAQDWQVDFTHMPLVKRVKFLLVFLCTFSWWIEAFLSNNKLAPTVTQLILIEILPRFEMPSSLQSDNGPKFTSQITQNIAQALQVPWRFYIPYHPWSSSKVERANRVLKKNSDQINTRSSSRLD